MSKYEQIKEVHENLARKRFIDTLSFFKLGNGWAGQCGVKPPGEEYWVKGESIDECKQKLLERYYYAT